MQSLPFSSPGTLVVYLLAFVLGGLFTTWDVFAFWILGLAFIVFLGMAVLDLMLAQVLWDRELAGEPWPWKKCALEKYVMAIFVVASAGLDVCIYLFVKIMPGEVAFLEMGWFWFTFSSLFFFIGYQAYQMARRYGSQGGVLPPHFSAASHLIAHIFLRGVRKVDNARWKETHPDDGTPPPERWIDTFTEEEIADILKEAFRRKQNDIPADPRELLDQSRQRNREAK
jgi:uncharacterized membrane protein YwaF